MALQRSNFFNPRSVRIGILHSCVYTSVYQNGQAGETDDFRQKTKGLLISLTNESVKTQNLLVVQRFYNYWCRFIELHQIS